jgi:hypothetical protein
MSFSFEIWTTFVFLLFIKKLFPPKFRPTYSNLVGRKHVWCLKYKHVSNFEDLRSRKNPTGNIPVIYFNRFWCCRKNSFGKLKMRFLPNAPIHLVWYIRSFLNVWKIVKVFFIWNINYIRVSIICFKSYHHANFVQKC